MPTEKIQNVFHTLEKIINENKELKNELNELFELQQEITQLKYIDKINMYEILRKDYDTKKRELENNPLVVNFLELQEEVNYILTQITFIIENELKIIK